MGQVLIRNLGADVIAAIRLKAELKGHSLEHELREIIKAAAPFSQAERSELIRQNMAKFPDPLPSFALEEIRKGLL
jgi:plasmid stability protein